MLYREIYSPYRAVSTHRFGYKTSQLMLYREIYSPYRAVNTLRFGYKNQSVNAV
jgi:hypothetical protein